jgi:hypothetical protein
VTELGWSIYQAAFPTIIMHGTSPSHVLVIDLRMPHPYDALEPPQRSVRGLRATLC